MAGVKAVVAPSRIGALSGLTYGIATPHPFDFTVTQISFVVRDLDATIAAYKNLLGWGPFNVFDMWCEGPKSLLRGKEVRYRIKWSECIVKPGINIEFIQPMEGPNVWQEWLEEKGEGVWALGVMMRSNEEGEQVKKWFAEKGIGVVMRGDVGDDIEWYLLDTVPMLKLMTICGGGHAIDWAYDTERSDQIG
jgi:methylmalonyl-CoA/ethylmalonyl-CoA epimerase